ncbi:MAG: IS1096 element passenger TnpR family protein [Acetobacteraceae bacterium]
MRERPGGDELSFGLSWTPSYGPPGPGVKSGETTPKAAPEAILQIKVWLKEISPMIWRRVLVPASFTLHDLHGVIQVAMGW